MAVFALHLQLTTYIPITDYRFARIDIYFLNISIHIAYVTQGQCGIYNR